MKLGLVINPGSERNKRGLPALREAVAAHPEILSVELADVADLNEVLADFARHEVNALCVAAGDGTVQAVLTQILERKIFETLPPLAVLPRGMTNLIAGDVGLRGSPSRALQSLCDCLRNNEASTTLAVRPILRLENLAGLPPQWGMFLGAAGIVRGAQLCFDKVHARGIKHNWATAATLLALMTAKLFGRDHSGVFRGTEISVALDNGPAKQRSRLLMFATTMERLILGSRPFWNLEGGPIRYTSIADPPKGVVRYAHRILYGGAERKLPEQTYESGSAHRLEIGVDEELMLDGEYIRSEPGKPIIVTAPREVRFIRT